MSEQASPVQESGERFRVSDRLFELLVDLQDEGERSLGEMRFYALRSFLPDAPRREDVIARLKSWLQRCRELEWVYACDARWSDVDDWLTKAEQDPHFAEIGAGPEVATTQTLNQLLQGELVEPHGATAWTWPEGHDRCW